MRMPPVILVLTDDAGLVEALSAGCRGRAQLRIAPSLERFTDLLITEGAGLLWLDYPAVGAQMPDLLARLRSQFPSLPLMLSGNGAEHRPLAEMLAADQALTFVHKPASGTRVGMLLQTALRNAAQAETAFTAADAAGVIPARNTSQRWLWLATLLLVAAGAWLAWSAAP